MLWATLTFHFLQRGKRGKGIEQAPAMESSKKKGRLANEPISLNIDEGWLIHDPESLIIFMCLFCNHIYIYLSA